MEVALLHSSSDHGSIYCPSKRMRNPKRSIQTRSFIPSKAYNNTTTPNLYQFPQTSLLPRPVPPPPSIGSRGNSPSPIHKKQNKGNNPSKQFPAKKLELCAVGRFGPNPDCLPQDVKNKKVLFVEDTVVNFIPKEAEKFSGSASFPLAPPSSSLPMPKFSLKPKLSCKVEAASFVGGGLIDTGATDNLCRLLNLR